MTPIADRNCEVCGGEGSILCEPCDGEGLFKGVDGEMHTCASCGGAGRSICKACDGTGSEHLNLKGNLK